MQSYTGIVSRAETEALKEHIFNRARQRAEALAKDTQDSYTSSFRYEVMNIARESFNAPGNPFAQPTQKVNDIPAKQETEEDIGFKQKLNEDSIKEIIKYKNDMVKASIAQKEISGVMNHANTEFVNSQKFMGALDFLNSQAGIYMASQNKAKFDTLA